MKKVMNSKFGNVNFVMFKTMLILKKKKNLRQKLLTILLRQLLKFKIKRMKELKKIVLSSVWIFLVLCVYLHQLKEK